MMKKLNETEFSPESKQLLEKDNNAASYLESVKGIIAVFSVVILNTISASCVQLLGRRIPDFELNTFRSVVPLIFLSIGLIMMRRWPRIDRSEIGLTILCSLLGSSSKMGELVAVTFLPAAAVSCLFSTSAITSGLCLFAVLLKETITVKKVLLAVVCICGAILVVQPWMEFRMSDDDFVDRRNLSVHGTKHFLPNLTGYVNNTADLSYETSYVHQEFNVSVISTSFETSTVNFIKGPIGTGLVSKIVGYSAAVTGGILLSTEVVIVKRNPFITQHIVEFLYWGWSARTAVSLILIFIIETPMLPSNWFDITMVTIHCVSGTAIWPLFIYQTKTIAGNTASLIMSTQVVFMLVSQYTVLSSILPGHRNWMEVVEDMGKKLYDIESAKNNHKIERP